MKKGPTTSRMVSVLLYLSESYTALYIGVPYVGLGLYLLGMGHRGTRV